MQLCALSLPLTDEARAQQEFPPRQPFLYSPRLLSSAPQFSGHKSSAEVPNTEDLSPLMPSDCTRFSSHWGEITFWKFFLSSMQATFSPNSFPHESERQRLKTILSTTEATMRIPFKIAGKGCTAWWKKPKGGAALFWETHKRETPEEQGSDL